MNDITPSQAAAALGRRSHLNPTRKQIVASRRNGRLGGRPRVKKAKQWNEPPIARLVEFPEAPAVNQGEVTP